LASRRATLLRLLLLHNRRSCAIHDAGTAVHNEHGTRRRRGNKRGDGTMNDSEVSQQVQQMLHFIAQEAADKANEIALSAEEVEGECFDFTFFFLLMTLSLSLSLSLFAAICYDLRVVEEDLLLLLLFRSRLKRIKVPAAEASSFSTLIGRCCTSM
jgi:hypothetical protein